MPSLQVYVDLYASLFRPCRENLLYLTHLLFELIEVCRLVFFFVSFVTEHDLWNAERYKR